MLRSVADDLLTVDGVVTLTGLSASAVRARIERGSIPVVREGGKVRVPLAELYKTGLVGVRGDLSIADLLDRLERQARRIGELEQQLRDTKPAR